MGNPSIYNYRASGRIAMSLALPMIILWSTLAGNTAEIVPTAGPNQDSTVESYEKNTVPPPIVESFDEMDIATVLPGFCDGREAQIDSWHTAKNLSPDDFRSMALNFLTRCTRAERKDISDDYFNKYYEEIAMKIKEYLAESNSDAQEIRFAQMSGTLSEHLASRLRDATELRMIKYDIVRLVLTSLSSPSEIDAVTMTYQNWFGEDLRKVLSEKTKNLELRKILSSQLSGRPNNDVILDDGVVREDVEKIWNILQADDHKGEDSDIDNILLKKSYYHVRKVVTLYKQIHGNDLESAIEKAYLPNVAQAYIDILKFAEDKAAWFASKLRSAILARRTDLDTVVFILTWRAEIDLGNIKKAYERLYKVPLSNDVTNIVEDDFTRDALQGIIGQ